MANTITTAYRSSLRYSEKSTSCAQHLFVLFWRQTNLARNQDSDLELAGLAQVAASRLQLASCKAMTIGIINTTIIRAASESQLGPCRRLRWIRQLCQCNATGRLIIGFSKLSDRDLTQ